MADLYTSLLVICLVVIIPTLYANVKEDQVYWDRQMKALDTTYWKDKALNATKANQEAYFPDPYAVTRNLTSSISQ